MKYDEKFFKENTLLTCVQVLKEKHLFKQDLDDLVICFTKKQFDDYKTCMPEKFIDDDHIKIMGYIWKIQIYENPFENMSYEEFKSKYLQGENMKKYVRTKFGKVYEIVGREKTPYGDYITSKGEHIKFDWVLKEADAIDDLCDEFVFFDKDNKPHYKSQEGNLWYLGASLYTETLKGAVWTEKGLIFVAKMNGEGKLELL